MTQPSNRNLNIEQLLSDEKLQHILQKLNLNEEDRVVLCEAFYESFIQSTSTDTHLNTIKDLLLKVSSSSISEMDLKLIVTEIAEHLEKHSSMFYQAVQRVQTLERKTDLLSEQILNLQEKSGVSSKQLVDLQEKLGVSSRQLVDLQEKLNYTEGLIIAHELSSMYIEYFVRPILLKHLGHSSWDKFTNILTNIEEEMDTKRLKAIMNGSIVDDAQLYQGLTSYLEPLQREIRCSLTDIRFLRNDRASLVHLRHKTVDEQMRLLEQAKQFKFSTHFEHKVLMEQIIDALELHKTKFHRCL